MEEKLQRNQLVTEKVVLKTRTISAVVDEKTKKIHYWNTGVRHIDSIKEILIEIENYNRELK